MKVRDVEAKHINGTGRIFTRSEFPDFIELPCLKACLHLYDLNIKTTSTNCNKENPYVELTFDFNSLSDENKEIARRLAEEGLIKVDENSRFENGCAINFNVNLDSEVEDISNKLMFIVSQFKLQDVLSEGFGISKMDFFNSLIIDAQTMLGDDDYSVIYSKIDGNFKYEFDENNNMELNYYGDGDYSDDSIEIIKKEMDRIDDYCHKVYDEMIEKGMVLETGDVFANEELAKKHLDYIEKTKGKKM